MFETHSEPIPLRRRSGPVTATVEAAEPLTPLAVRVHLSCPELFSGAPPAVAAWVRGRFPVETAAPVTPSAASDSAPAADAAPDLEASQSTAGLPGPALAARAYTLVEMDPAAGRFALDFVLHGSGPAASWARQAAPGQRLEISRPLGRARIDPKHRHYLLAGDATALPAIREWLRLLPGQATAAVRVWLPAQSEVQELGGRSGIDLKWFFPGDPSMAELAEAGSLAPAGWTPADPETRFVVAGEAGEVTRVRRAVSWDAKPLPGNLHAAGYWRRGKPSDGAAVELG